MSPAPAHEPLPGSRVRRDRSRRALRRLLVLVASFGISAALATPLSSGARSTPQDLGGALTALPRAFATGRPVPLGDARDVARWAPVLRTTVARRSPSERSAAVARVPARTPEGTTDIVEASGEVERRGQLWVRVRVAALPNGTEGWMPRRFLGGWSFVDTHLVIDRARLTAILLRAGRVIFRAPVGVGAAGTPTPAGSFYVRDRLSGFSSPMYGPLAFGTNARSPTLTDWPDGAFVGIHGTNRPDLIPGRVSHGCIRLKNAAILRLGKLMPVGTPVTIT